MAFARNLDDPIQRRKQQFDDLLSGKRKKITLDSIESLESDIAAEKKQATQAGITKTKIQAKAKTKAKPKSKAKAPSNKN